MRLILKFLDIWTLYWFVAGLLLGAVIHITTILALPIISEHKAWDRIGKNFKPNEMVLLPPVTPESQPLPFMAPDIRYAVCRFNIKQHPLRVQAHLLNELWSVAIFNQKGENVYTLSGSGLKSRNVEINISLAENDIPSLGVLANAPLGQGIPLKLDDAEGLVMVRAPVVSEVYAEEALTHLAFATCKPRRS